MDIRCLYGLALEHQVFCGAGIFIPGMSCVTRGDAAATMTPKHTSAIASLNFPTKPLMEFPLIDPNYIDEWGAL